MANLASRIDSGKSCHARAHHFLAACQTSPDLVDAAVSASTKSTRFPAPLCFALAVQSAPHLPPAGAFYTLDEPNNADRCDDCGFMLPVGRTVYADGSRFCWGCGPDRKGWLGLAEVQHA